MDAAMPQRRSTLLVHAVSSPLGTLWHVLWHSFTTDCAPLISTLASSNDPASSFDDAWLRNCAADSYLQHQSPDQTWFFF